MIKLIIRNKGQVSSEMVLDSSKSWIAGRKSDADIVLDSDKGISREHFRIYEENGVWNLEVLSKLGNVTSNGETITAAILAPGEKFSLPPFDFEVAAAEVNSSETAVISDSESVSFSDRTIVHKVSFSAYIKVVNEEGDVQQKIKLEGGDTWMAGRDVNSPIMISDHKVSRRQFEIRKTNLGYEIVDLGSVNGTFINEKVLEPEDAVVLKSGDIIRVLNHTLVFEILDPNFFEKIENLPALSEPEEIEPEQGHYLPADAQEQFQQQTQQAAGQSFGQEQFDMAPPIEDAAAARTKKFRMVLVAIIVVGGLFYLLSGPTQESSGLSNVAPSGADPLSALTPQQKSEYKQSLELAKRYHMEGNYSLSLSEAEEISKKFNVKDPELERVKNTAQAAIESQKILIRQEKEAKERDQMEARITAVTALCEKDLNRFNREEELDNCLVDALQLNPAHPSVLDLKAKMQMIMVEKEARQQQKADYNRRVSQLKALHGEARKVETEGDYIRTIDAYKRVIASSLPDPNGLKKASENRLAKLRIEMANKIKEYQIQAEQHKSKQQLKQAILVLRAAVKIDPTREDLKEKAEDLKNELRKVMMVYYQEGVLEESFGNVEGGDNRAGAKEKWKKILDQDVTDGEYYQKAYIKLKKYGAT